MLAAQPGQGLPAGVRPLRSDLVPEDGSEAGGAGPDTVRLAGAVLAGFLILMVPAAPEEANWTC